MPTFDTPTPIAVTVSVLTADLRVRAGDRADTVVSVRPGDGTDDEDTDAAARTHVALVDGRLEIRAPRSWRRFRPGRTGGSLEIEIDLPSGSSLEVDASLADVRAEGRLGACRLAASMGAFVLDETGPLRASTYGEVSVGGVDGPAEVTGGRTVRLARVDGDAEVRNQNGDIRIGLVTGALRARTANGPVTVDAAGTLVSVRSADGDLRVGSVAEGAVDLQTAQGRIDVGVAHGTAAQLDVSTLYGRLHHELDAADGPGDAVRTATVRARTSFGDVVVARSHQHAEEQR